VHFEEPQRTHFFYLLHRADYLPIVHVPIFQGLEYRPETPELREQYSTDTIGGKPNN